MAWGKPLTLGPLQIAAWDTEFIHSNTVAIAGRAFKGPKWLRGSRE